MMALVRVASCLALACCASAASPCLESEGCTANYQQDPVALMQMNSKVQRGSGIAKDPKTHEPLPVGRTLISTNAVNSAKFFTTYFDAKDVEVPACSHQIVTAVELQIGFGKTATYVFVQDDKLPTGGLNAPELVSEVKAKMEDVFAGKEGKYNAWIDNHDGFNQTSFKMNKALADGVQVGIFAWTVTSEVFGIVRFLIPDTLFTFELVAPKTEIDPYKLPEFIAEDCRDDRSMPNPDPVFGAEVAWFKTTMMTAMPGVAAGWAKDILRISDYPAPFPWPPAEGCTEAVWAIFPESSYMMHFVLSAQFQATESLGSEKGLVQQFTDEVYKFRNLHAGTFDHFMLNNLILRMDSLDPVVQRLQAAGQAFLLTRVGEEYALFVDIPQNAQIVQIRSAHVSVAEPVALDGVCLV